MLFENVCHLVCHKHPCSFVVVVFVDFVLGGERVVFGVFASSSVLGVRDCNACCSTVIFASPCFRAQAVHCRKLSDGNASASLDEFVPVSGKNLPLHNFLNDRVGVGKWERREDCGILCGTDGV